MFELRKLVVNCKKAITQLSDHLEYNQIEMPMEFGLGEMREWFLVAQGYAECLEKHCLIKEKD